MYDDNSYSCPHCGAELAESATFCAECGSDAENGWSDDAHYAGLDLPDEEEDEYERQAAAAPRTLWQQIMAVTALILIILISGALLYTMLIYFAAAF